MILVEYPLFHPSKQSTVNSGLCVNLRRASHSLIYFVYFLTLKQCSEESLYLEEHLGSNPFSWPLGIDWLLLAMISSTSFKMGHSLTLFLYFRLSYKQLTVNMFNKSCRWLDSDPGHLVSEATELSTEPQPLPPNFNLFAWILCMWQVWWLYDGDLGFLKVINMWVYNR